MNIEIEQTKQTPARPLAALPGPRGWPIIGNLAQISPSRLHLQLEAWARRYGDLYVVRVVSKPIVVISNPAITQQILRERPRSFRRLGVMREAIDEMGAAGLFTAEGDTWSRQRRLVMAAFGASHLREGHASIAEITRRLARTWDAAAARGTAVDALRDLMRYTVDVTSVVGFGTDLNTIEHGTHALQRHLEVIFGALNRRVNAPFPLWRYVKLPRDHALDRSLAEVERVILDLIRRARAELDADPARAAAPRNLLEAMLAARDGDDERARLSDREVYGNVFTVLLAGEDTTSSTLAWMLYYMARHPEVQARMAAEADAQLGDADVPQSPEAVQKLRTITAVAHETLRLKSAAPFVAFEPLADTTLGGARIPAGTWLMLLTRFIATQDASFHDAATFDPTRWLGPVPAGHKHDPRAALAFGAGPRMCPGRALAMLECAMMGAMVARRFEVSLADPAAAVDERVDFTMKPEGLRVKFRAREAGAARG